MGATAGVVTLVICVLLYKFQNKILYLPGINEKLIISNSGLSEIPIV